MGDDVSWSVDELIEGNVLRRSFRIHRSVGQVPGTVWIPVARSKPGALVLLGHGGSGDRHSSRITSMAARLNSAGIAAAAIDGPFHGERVKPRLSNSEYQARIAADGIDAVLDRMAGDWVATCDVLTDAGIAERANLGYFGLSMGTRFGLASAVALAPGVRCAVFGKFGTQSSPDMNPALQAPARALDAASRISIPILFHLQWHDEVFPRAGQLELFDAFASSVKELHGFAGGHAPHTGPFSRCLAGLHRPPSSGLKVPSPSQQTRSARATEELLCLERAHLLRPVHGTVSRASHRRGPALGGVGYDAVRRAPRCAAKPVSPPTSRTYSPPRR
jgi:dienelactone hydrolase